MYLFYFKVSIYYKRNSLTCTRFMYKNNKKLFRETRIGINANLNTYMYIMGCQRPTITS